MATRAISVPFAVATGPYSKLDELLKLRALAGALRLNQPRRVRGALAGQRSSNARGRGIEFEEVRDYAAGDDVRTIDWRVTARTGRTHTKLFREERERPVLILVDQRSSMFFGSRRTLKSVQALHAAALLAWATLQANDRIGGLAFGDRVMHEVRPRRSHRAVIALLRHCHSMNLSLGIPSAVDAQPPSRLADAISQLRRVARPGSHVWLLSDFHDYDDDADRQLHLLARHCEITGVFIHDALEATLPASGRGIVTDGVRRALLDTSSAATRSHRQQQFERHKQHVASCFARIGAPLIPLATDEAALDVLGRAINPRRAQ
jgi:uncharacterized protein (DUF58 family)